MSWDKSDATSTADLTPPPGPFPWGWAANRRMCTGVYLDRQFRDRLLRTVYCARKRRVAPSYGFDLVLVLTHAWRAWRLELAQDAVVVAILLVALIREPIEALMAAAAMAIWYLTHALLRLAREFAAYYRGDRSYSDFEKMRSRGSVISRAALVACIVLVVAIFVRWRENPGAHEPWFIRSGALDAAAIFLGLLAASAIGGAMRQMKVNWLRMRDSEDHRAFSRRMKTVRMQQRHPFVVYSGFSPFIGSGLLVRTWSFAQRLIHEKPTGREKDQEFKELPFPASEIVERLKTMITELAEDRHKETCLPGLTVKDQVFLEGTHAEPYLAILQPGRTQRELEEAISEAIASTGEVARHYLTCQVASWGGEVVTTVFVHVSLQGRTLYLEFSTYALLPTRQEYHIVDEVGGTGAAAVIRGAMKAVTSASDAFLAPRRMLVALSRAWDSVLAQWDGTAVLRRGLNIGAQISARESAATESDEQYFQLRDIFQHSKVIERRLIATVGDFLRERNVDTSEFWQRATTILNNGVLATNVGAVTVMGSAFGENATVENIGVSGQQAATVDSGSG